MATITSNLTDDQVVGLYLFAFPDYETGALYYSPKHDGKPRIDTEEVAVQLARMREAKVLMKLEIAAADERARIMCKEIGTVKRDDIDDGEPGGFDAIVGMQELKDQIEEEVLFPLQNKELMKEYKIHPSNGMLLYGPPGCGKTFFATKFAEESEMNIKFIRASDVGSKYVHNTSKNIKELFDEAKLSAPCVICIDEIDAICPARNASSEEGERDYNESVDEFLSQMSDCHKHGIFVIGTTNNPLAIDAALLRTGRMDNIVYVPMPDEESRRAMLVHYMKDRPQDEGIDYDTLAKLTDGMNCSDIEAMVNIVALRAARRYDTISNADLSEQAKNQRRSVYIPKDDDVPETAITDKKHVIGFANYQSKRV